MKGFRRHANTNLHDPVPLIRDFFRRAKDQRPHPQPLTARDYATIREILEARRHRRFNGQSVANLLLAIAYHHTQWRLLPRSLAAQLWDAIAKNVERLNPQGIANTLWTLATMNVRRRELEVQGLSDRLLDAVHRNAQRFSPQGIANALWALATTGMRWRELETRELSNRLFNAVQHSAERFSSQQIANTLWALAMMALSWGYLKEQRVDRLLLNAIDQSANQFSLEESTQIMWSTRWFDIRPPPEILLKISNMKPPRSSDLHRHVASVLSAQINGEIPIENEFFIQNCFYVDICIPSKRLVIEVDGPYHIPTKDEFKERLLRKWDYTVERVSYRDEDKIEERVNTIVDRYQLNPLYWEERKFLGNRTNQPLAEQKEDNSPKNPHDPGLGFGEV
ncbi:DUF1601 domain-containing protein [Coxiella burnetii]|uniref:DUF1601 domain-containing protein n=1 Tax=Coxiella burnetii TaxID=777 RepID=UPI0022325EFE|nr:DUF1601 domain-containing protein [Coxiella burnetii]